MNVRGTIRLYKVVRSGMLSAAICFVKHVLRNKIFLKAGFPDENMSETGICQVSIGCVLGARRVFVFGVGFLFPGLVGVVVASCFVSGCLVSSVFSDVELL